MRIRLETNDVLPEAISLYRSSGYVEVPVFNDEPFADRWFSKNCDQPDRAEADIGPATAESGWRFLS